MKRYLWILIFLAVGIYPALAAAKAASGQDAPIAKEGRTLVKAEDITGTLTSVDTTAGTMTVLLNGTPYVFQVPAKARINIHGNQAGLEALKDEINQNVSIHFVPRSSGNIALSVEVSSKAKPEDRGPDISDLSC